MDVREKSISREYTFLKDETSREVLEDTLRELVDDVAARLRADGRLAGLGRLKLRRHVVHQIPQLDILNPTNQTMDELMKTDLSAGVEIEIKTY